MQLFRDYSPLKLNPACNQIFRRYDSTTYLSKKKIENEFKEFENSKKNKKKTLQSTESILLLQEGEFYG